MVLRFLFHVGRAVAHQGVGKIAGAMIDPTLASAGNLIGQIGADAWAGLRAEKKQDRLNADILDAAKMDFAEIKRQAVEIAAQVAPNDPVMRDHVERFVTLVPASIVASLKRADDPTGTTLPYNYVIEDESDIVKLLPVRFPRAHFRPGYAPPFLRGWELVTQLGAGGFGEVWQVRNLRTTNLVRAVKFGHALNDAELSLLNEGDVLNRLLAHGKHAGIVELHGVWADGDEVPWLMYEYVPGGDLTGLMRKWAALPMEQRLPKVLAAFRELCETVGHFHRLSPAIVHRDLKPSNILVTADDKLKVGDFGIGSVSAKRTLDGERRGTLSRTNTVQAYLRGAHTPLYAPPEQKADPKHRPQPTDDVHALGVILFQMLTGKLDAAPGARFDRELAGVPKDIVELIGDCVDAEKSRRPADAGAVLDRSVVEVHKAPRPTEPVVALTVPPAALPPTKRFTDAPAVAPKRTNIYDWIDHIAMIVFFCSPILLLPSLAVHYLKLQADFLPLPIYGMALIIAAGAMLVGMLSDHFKSKR